MTKLHIKRNTYNAFNLADSVEDIEVQAIDIQQDVQMLTGKDGIPARSQALIFLPYDTAVDESDLIVMKDVEYPILQINYVTDFNHIGSHLEVTI